MAKIRMRKNVKLEARSKKKNEKVLPDMKRPATLMPQEACLDNGEDNRCLAIN